MPFFKGQSSHPLRDCSISEGYRNSDWKEKATFSPSRKRGLIFACEEMSVEKFFTTVSRSTAFEWKRRGIYSVSNDGRPSKVSSQLTKVFG